MKRNSVHVLRAVCEYSGVDYNSGDEANTLRRKLRRRAPHALVNYAALLHADRVAFLADAAQRDAEQQLTTSLYREETEAALRLLMQYGVLVREWNPRLCFRHWNFSCDRCDRMVRITSLRPLEVTVKASPLHFTRTVQLKANSNWQFLKSVAPGFLQLDSDELHEAARALLPLDQCVDANMPLLPCLRDIVKGYVGGRIFATREGTQLTLTDQ